MDDEGAAHPLPQSLHALNAKSLMNNQSIINDFGQEFFNVLCLFSHNFLITFPLIHSLKMLLNLLRIVSCYLSFGDGVHDGDGAERRQVVTAGVVVHLRQAANRKAAG